MSCIGNLQNIKRLKKGLQKEISVSYLKRELAGLSVGCVKSGREVIFWSNPMPASKTRDQEPIFMKPKNWHWVSGGKIRELLKPKEGPTI